jgi:hypothetical protein
MNANETKYERHLQARHFAGEVIWYAFEAVTLKLGPDCRYTVDFIVLLADGMLECHEVKAGKRDRQTGERTFWAEEDAKLKVRVAAGMFPLRFCIVYPTPEGWERKEF